MKELIRNSVFLFLLFTLPLPLIYSQTGILRGIVKDEENFLQSATVTINNRNILTNVNGEFSISLTPGLYTISITHAGYKKLEQEVKIEPGKTRVMFFNMLREETLGEVVILGSQSSVHRSNMNTPFPVDAIATRDLVKNRIEISQMIAMVAPSFNSPPQVLGPAATSVPATLGGLAPDQTLVLLNGMRLHSSSYTYKVLAMGRGTVSTDINAIPQTAIEKVEILRSGASAQYGSDAIAGVVNLQLKKSVGKTFINLHSGQYYKGDGETISLGINHGIALNKKGFLNLSAVLDYRSDAWRSEGYYTGRVYTNNKVTDDSIILARGFDRKKHWRTGPHQIKSAGFLMNAGYPVSRNTRIFWTVSLAGRETMIDAGNYSYPKDTLQVITELYPNGFRVIEFHNTKDVATIAGMEGNTRNGWNWSLSATYGGNWWDVNLHNSNNTSQYQLGKNAQADFYCGSTAFQQNTNNFNLTRDFSKQIPGMKLFALSTGVEFRLENYSMKAGEEASYENYARASGRPGGSQVVPGNSPENAVNKNRFVGAGYINLEAEQNEKLLYNISGRYEYYNDFGDNLAGKLALRYKFSDRLTLRGSISNGFRAPGLPQRYYSSVVQKTTPGTGSKSYKQYTFPNDSKIAYDFGIPSLAAEKSLHLSTGITSKLSKHLKLIADAYWIEIRDRIVLSGIFYRDSNAVVDQILSANGYTDISAVIFFVNAINTLTKGLDVALWGKWKIKKSLLEVSVAANFNQTRLYGDIKKAGKLPDDSINANQLFNREERGKIESAQPRSKIIFLTKYHVHKWEFTMSNIRYGKVAHIRGTINQGLDEFFSSKIVTDISVSCGFKKWLTIAAGARNIFNVYPDPLKNQLNTMQGRIVYDNSVTQFGNSGGYYFFNVEFNL